MIPFKSTKHVNPDQPPKPPKLKALQPLSKNKRLQIGGPNQSIYERGKATFFVNERLHNFKAPQSH